MSLVAFVLRFGGLGSIEYRLETLMDVRLYKFQNSICTPVCTPALPLIPPAAIAKFYLV